MESLTVLDTLANIGLLLFLFLVGLELDLASLHRTGSRACHHRGPLIVFMGVALSITAFPMLARILAELKLLTTNLRHMYMSVAAINDITAWILFALDIVLSGSSSPFVSVSRSPPPRGDVEQKQWRCSAPAASLGHSSRASADWLQPIEEREQW